MESAALPRKARGPGLFLMVVILELPMNCARSSVRVMTIFRIVPIAAIYLAALALSACATPSRLAPEPAPAMPQASAGITNVRFLVARDSSAFQAEALSALAKEKAWLAAQGRTGDLPTAYYLAISGGGDNGAFGAGFLNGWTASGTRPEFKVVTGVSTGALIAPFAFLGAIYQLYKVEAVKPVTLYLLVATLAVGDAGGVAPVQIYTS